MNLPQSAPQAGQMYDLACDYASRRGWHTFAITYNSKIPIKGSNGFKDATTDPVLLKRLWKQQTLANVAIATEASGLFVVDVDVSNEKVGAETWADLVARHGHTETYTVRTWSGGLQFYYQMPSPALSSGTSNLGPDVDTRGIGGYVVAAGSRVEGLGYTVECDAPVAACPQWIIDALTKPVRAPYPTFDAEAAESDEVVSRVAALAAELEGAEDGTGNDTAARKAFMVGQYVGAGQIDEHLAIGMLLDAVAGWTFRKDADYKTLISTIERQVAIGAQKPRPWVARKNDPQPVFETPDATVPGVEPERPSDYRDAVQLFRTLDLDAGERPEENAYFTDLRQAEAFYERMLVMPDGQPRYIWTPEFHWMIWTGTVWRDVPDTHMLSVVRVWSGRQMAYAVKYAEKLLVEAAPRAVADRDKAATILKDAQERGKVMIKGWNGRLAIVRMEAVAKLARSLALKENQRFDQNPNIINTPSGVVNLKTGVVRPARPSDRCRKITAADYVPGFTHPDWDLALKAVPEDTREWFQMYMGQAITGFANREDQMVIMHGGGSNGKTLVMKAASRAMGSYFAALSDRALEAGANAHPTELMDLYGARLALLEETEEARQLDTNRLKKIVGTETIKARYMNKDSTEFSATHSLVINTNHRPLVKETDHGTWRRLLLFPFPFTFRAPHEELHGENDFHGDLGLKTRIEGDEQRRAVLAWLIDGAVAWYKNGEVMGDPPERIREATSAWRKENDVVMGFLDAGIVHLVPGAHVLSIDLLAALNTYLHERGHHPWTVSLMNSRLGGHDALAGQVQPKRIKAGSGPSHSLSLMPGVSDRRYGVGVHAYAVAPPVTGQYMAWSGFSFTPVNSVTSQPLDNIMSIGGE